MDKDKMIEYSNHYKRVQNKLTLVVTGALIFFACILILAGIIIVYFNHTIPVIITSGIMIILGGLDFILAFKFKKSSLERIKKMKPEEAANRYMKITGNR